MKSFWENKFDEIGISWGMQPSDSAVWTCDLFLREKKNHVLIPGVGYGRNAKVFLDSCINVTGIEISEVAIKLAREIGLTFKIYDGSVNDMPFDNVEYDGIFCYALIHLLNKFDRKKLILNCHKQLSDNGIMVFIVVSTKSSMYGTGKELSKNRFQISQGLNVYFYDQKSAEIEFKEYGLVDIQEIDEPVKHMENEPPMNFLMITCRKYHEKNNLQ